MNLLDMKTIFLAMLATDILCTLVLVQLWRQSRERFAGTGLWALDYAFHTVALPLVLLRGVVPDWMSMVLSNTMVLASALCGFMGLERFVGKRGPQGHNVLLLIVFPLVHGYFVYIQPDLRMRSINISIGLLILCFQCLWLMFVRVGSPMRALTRDVGLVFGAFCLISVLRIFWLATASFVSQDYFQSSTPEALVPLFYQLLLIFLTYSLSLMVNKRLLMDIKNEEEKLSKVFHCSPNAIVISRLSDGKIVDVNDGFVSTIGYSSVEVLGKTTLDLHIWQSREIRDALVTELSERGSVRGLERQFKTKSGETKTGLVLAETIFINDEKHIVSNIIDITERKRAEEERLRLEQQVRLLQKSESLATMAGAIAHNFNNMLGAIIGNLELALHGAPVEAGLTIYIDRAMEASRRAAEISRFMLTYVGQTLGKKEPIQLAEVVREVQTLLRASLPVNVRLESQLPAEGPVIHADGPHIRQIVTNLIGNAVEALGEAGGRIGLTLEVAGSEHIDTSRCFPVGWEPKARDYACLLVCDTGPGLDSATIERIFDPFFTTKFTGRGMGLPVVLGLMRACEGAVSIESRPGEGAAFRVYFPMPERETPPSRDIASTSRRIEGNGLVLVVDDEPLVRGMVHTMLERILGYQAITAGNGPEAVEVLGAHKNEVRLVLLDLSMPGMNGWETLAALRALRSDIPVILASGYDEAQAMAGVHAEQPQAFLQKPYNSEALEKALSLALGERRPPANPS